MLQTATATVASLLMLHAWAPFSSAQAGPEPAGSQLVADLDSLLHGVAEIGAPDGPGPLCIFDWEAYRSVFAPYRALPDEERPKNDAEKRDQWLVRFSRQVGRNLGPFFEA